MGSLKLTTASSGSVILSPANTASDVTITVPAVTGTMITTASTFAGTGPAFSAYLGTNQSITTSTWTKIQFNVKEFDTNNNFDATTNYRFTPTVAGYYQVNGRFDSTVSTTLIISSIYKNGSSFKRGLDSRASQSGGGSSNVAALIYMNGSTDYLELYCYITGTSPSLVGDASVTFFQGSLVRAA